jgi:hypothetical protein
MAQISSYVGNGVASKWLCGKSHSQWPKSVERAPRERRFFSFPHFLQAGVALVVRLDLIGRCRELFAEIVDVLRCLYHGLLAAAVTVVALGRRPDIPRQIYALGNGWII